MRLRSIIIDDEETGIETLKLLIERYIDDVKVVSETTQSTKAIELIEDFKPEIVFLDISMPEMDGFELLEKLELKKFNLIFTTAHQEYALKALKQNAIDYLLKPVDYRDLRIAIDKVKKQMADELVRFDYSSIQNIFQHQAHKLGVNSKEGVEYIDPLDIISLESSSNYTRLYLNDSSTILSPKSLKEFETQLCDNNLNFMRVHYSFVINLRKVSRYLKDEEDIIMVNNQKIPLAKSRRDVFMKWLNPQGT